MFLNAVSPCLLMIVAHVFDDVRPCVLTIVDQVVSYMFHMLTMSIFPITTSATTTRENLKALLNKGPWMPKGRSPSQLGGFNVGRVGGKRDSCL
jgi:hypothetical protein